jgi:hypothetical protein
MKWSAYGQLEVSQLRRAAIDRRVDRPEAAASVAKTTSRLMGTPMTFKRTVTAVSLMALCTLSFAPEARAGDTIPGTVTINQYGSYTLASGSIEDARFASDPNEYIGCDMQWSNGGGTIAYCFAYDGNRYISCVASNSFAIEAISSVGRSSFITFEVLSGTCVLVDINNTSYALN